MEIWRFKDNWVTPLTFCGHVTSSVTWPFDSRGRVPMGGPWWPCVYVAPLRRYGASKIMGLRVWPFGVTWGHRSRDQSTPGRRVSMGGP